MEYSATRERHLWSTLQHANDTCNTPPPERIEEYVINHVCVCASDLLAAGCVELCGGETPTDPAQVRAFIFSNAAGQPLHWTQVILPVSLSSSLCNSLSL